MEEDDDSFVDAQTSFDSPKPDSAKGQIPDGEAGRSMFGIKPRWGWDYAFVFRAPKFKPGRVRQAALARCASSDTTYNQFGGSESHSDIPDRNCAAYADTFQECKEIALDAADCELTDNQDEAIKNANEARLDTLARLRSAGFQCSQIYVPTENAVYVLFGMTNRVQMEKAQKMGMELKLKREYGGGYLGFTVERKSCFENEAKMRGGMTAGSYFCPSDRSIIILATLESKEEWGCGLDIETLLFKKRLLQAFALHSEDEQSILRREAVWERWWDPTWKPPFDKLKSYLGARVSLYFVFVSFYAHYLLGIAILSLPAYLVYRLLRNNFVIAILRWIFGMSLVLWTTMFLENWKRRNAMMNIDWGLNDYHDDATDKTRPQFKGELRHGFYSKGGFVSLDDLAAFGEDDDAEKALGNRERDTSVSGLPRNPWQDPRRSRNIFIQSTAVTSLSTLAVGTCVFLILWFRTEIVDYVAQRANSGSFGNAAPGILNGIVIFVSDGMWQWVSMALTRRENHRTNQSFENSLILKRFSFQFISNYSSLFYIAFIKPRALCRPGYINPLEPNCMVELESQMMALVITKATLQQVVEVGMPLMVGKIKQYLSKRKVVHDSKLSEHMNDQNTSNLSSRNCELIFASSPDNKYVSQAKLPPYESTMSDYSELALQWGFLCMFGLAFPCAALVGLLNNLVEVRTDAYKVVVLSQRTNADDTADIGAWYHILQFLGFLSVLTNAGLLIYTSKSLKYLFGTEDAVLKVVAFFVTEHVLFMLKGLAAGLIKDIPGRTHRVLARQEYDIARHFNVAWRNAFRGNSLLNISEDHVTISRRNLNVFRLVSQDGKA